MADSTSLKPLVLDAHHKRLGARFAPFAGYRMPLQYSGIVDEHRAVRQGVGVFDVSHMGNFFAQGPDVVAAIDRVVTNDIAALPIGKAAYTVMCTPEGGIIDDLIVYKLASDRLMIIVNASTRAGDWAHFVEQLSGVALVDRTDEFVLLAVQGPRAQEVLDPLVDVDLSEIGTYWVGETRLRIDGHPESIVARTGYTGEDGFEVLIPNADAGAFFDALFAAGAHAEIKPAGLGARDTLRLEAKYPLYGQDITLETNPLEAGLGWVVKLRKETPFIGRDALRAIRRGGGVSRRLRGVIMRTRGVLRPHYPLFLGERQIGALTSGSMSPTLGHAIGLSYIDLDAADAEGV